MVSSSSRSRSYDSALDTLAARYERPGDPTYHVDHNEFARQLGRTGETRTVAVPVTVPRPRRKRHSYSEALDRMLDELITSEPPVPPPVTRANGESAAARQWCADARPWSGRSVGLALEAGALPDVRPSTSPSTSTSPSLLPPVTRPSTKDSELPAWQEKEVIDLVDHGKKNSKIEGSQALTARQRVEVSMLLRMHYPRSSKVDLAAIMKLAMDHHSGMLAAKKNRLSDFQLDEILQLFGLSGQSEDGEMLAIDLSSFMRASRILDMGEAERQSLFHKYDADGNGAMDIDEFRTMMDAEPKVLAQLDLVCHNMKRIQTERRAEALGIQRHREENGLRGWAVIKAWEKRRPSLADIYMDTSQLQRAIASSAADVVAS